MRQLRRKPIRDSSYGFYSYKNYLIGMRYQKFGFERLEGLKV